LSECKHGLEKSWCVVCKGTTVLIVRDPSIAMCCAPLCDKASSTQVASLPLCEPHFNRLESHVAKVHTPPDWDKIFKKAERVQDGEDWVYFIRLGDVIKIGHSRRLMSRLRSFAAYGQEVEVLALEIGGRALETRLHRRFSHLRSDVGFSKELFRPDPEILGYIKSGRKCGICDDRARPQKVTCKEHAITRYWVPEEKLIGVQLHTTRASA
jgi:hypothetical protein